VNQRIRQQVERNVTHAAVQGRDAINRRLWELDREWDMERILEANASALALLGVLLGAFVNLWWLILPGLVTSLLLLHAVQGWCPPVPLFRRLGVRTMTEIDHERYALKALRGDFQGMNTSEPFDDTDAHDAISRARA
jgi:hypothetical protein